MEDAVKDSFLTRSDDRVLNILVELAIDDLNGRPLFDNPLSEPIFYRRYFKRWVEEGYEEQAAVQKAADDAQQKAMYPNSTPEG